jgi:dolichol-phosphate mannosyltransferase
MLYFAYILYTLFAHPEQVVQGWTSLIIVVLILSGVQIIFIGLIGEYVARIFEEAKGRPLYFFKQRPRHEPRATGAGPGTPSGGA